MNVDDKVSGLIAKVKAGKLAINADSLSGTELGVYIPAYVEDGTVKLIPDDFSLNEKDLKITVSKKPLIPTDEDMQTVAWLGDIFSKDSKCKHGGTSSCKHCTGHTQACHHCSKHTGKMVPDFGLDKPDFGLDAPELDYDDAISVLPSKRDVLKDLAKDGFGLALLHGHNDVSKFTKLPEGYVSVISGGVTQFRRKDDVAMDATFVPNIWRFENGDLSPAGGFSGI